MRNGTSSPCSIMRAFSILTSSDGSPSAFHLSCSLSVLRNCLRLNDSNPVCSSHSASQLLLSSSGLWLRYVMNAAASRLFQGNCFSSSLSSPTWSDHRLCSPSSLPTRFSAVAMVSSILPLHLNPQFSSFSCQYFKPVSHLLHLLIESLQYLPQLNQFLFRPLQVLYQASLLSLEGTNLFKNVRIPDVGLDPGS